MERAWRSLSVLIGLVIAFIPPPALRADTLGNHHLGVNYIQIDTATNRHNLFRQFHRDRIARDFQEISSLHFDLVRVFVGAEAYPKKPERLTPDTPVVKNLYELLKLADDNHLRIIITFEHWVPQSYLKLYAKENGSQEVLSDSQGLNAYILDGKLVQAHAQSVADLIGAVIDLAKRRGETLKSLFAVDLANELSFYVDHAPFPSPEKEATLPATLASQETRKAEQIIERGVDTYIRVHRAALVGAGYRGFVTLSGFSPGPLRLKLGKDYLISHPGSPSRRPVSMRYLRQRADLDFISINVYPSPQDPSRSIDALLDGFHIFGPDCRCSKTPVLVTEFGQIRDFYKGIYRNDQLRYRFISNAIRALCRRNIAGWLYWTWNTEGNSIPLISDHRLLRALQTSRLASALRCL